MYTFNLSESTNYHSSFELVQFTFHAIKFNTINRRARDNFLSSRSTPGNPFVDSLFLKLIKLFLSGSKVTTLQETVTHSSEFSFVRHENIGPVVEMHDWVWVSIFRLKHWFAFLTNKSRQRHCFASLHSLPLARPSSSILTRLLNYHLCHVHMRIIVDVLMWLIHHDIIIHTDHFLLPIVRSCFTRAHVFLTTPWQRWLQIDPFNAMRLSIRELTSVPTNCKWTCLVSGVVIHNHTNVRPRIVFHQTKQTSRLSYRREINNQIPYLCSCVFNDIVELHPFAEDTILSSKSSTNGGINDIVVFHYFWLIDVIDNTESTKAIIRQMLEATNCISFVRVDDKTVNLDARGCRVNQTTFTRKIFHSRTDVATDNDAVCFCIIQECWMSIAQTKEQVTSSARVVLTTLRLVDSGINNRTKSTDHT